MGELLDALDKVLADLKAKREMKVPSTPYPIPKSKPKNEKNFYERDPGEEG